MATKKPTTVAKAGSKETAGKRTGDQSSISDRISRRLDARETPTREEWLEWYKSMDEYGQRFCWEILFAFTELDDAEKVALQADLDHPDCRNDEKLGIVQMHRSMAKLKRADPELYADTAAR